MSKINDSDLREALRRSEEKRQATEVPDDFLASVMGEIEAAEPAPVLWKRWLAVAAGIAALIGVGGAFLLLGTPGNETNDGQLAANTGIDTLNAAQQAVVEVVADTLKDLQPNVAEVQPAAPAKPATTRRASEKAKPQRELVAANAATDNATAQPKVEAESPVATPDTTAAPRKYQSPARMDEFISKLAANQGAAKTVLDCTADRTEGAVDMAYTFSEKTDFDLINRLLVSASSFPDTAQGYFLNYSPQQFFFSIDDERDGQSYLWIAERVGDEKCILYSLHSQAGAEDITECYLQYRSKLISNNINTFSNL